MINVEIKAHATKEQHESVKAWLNDKRSFGAAAFKGTDLQVDTYFKVPHGRLKLREGNIENCLIQYDRPDQAGPKISNYKLVYFKPNSPIKEALTASLGVLVVVSKTREIYYLDNVKVHLDEIAGLGHFIEIEARDELENIGLPRLREQCDKLIKVFGIGLNDLISESYSDMLLKGQ